MKMESSGGRRGFALIELLVVAAIITLLIAILLPSLAGAKRQANAVKCGANLHGIAQAQLVYASEWSDSIAGGTTTSGSIMYSNAFLGNAGRSASFDSNTTPPVFQVFDWISPLASNLNIPIVYPTPNTHAASCLYLFETERKSKILTCPSNDFIAEPYSGSTIQCSIGPMPSYNMAMMFLFNAGYPRDDLVNSEFLTLPDGYKPKVSLVGTPSHKIMVADGSRYSTASIKPDCDLSEYSTEGGIASDIGAFDSFSRSWDRETVAPTSPNLEPRFYSFRHGQGTKGGPAGTFKMNAAFFDGHVEILNDWTAADPALWSPTGTLVPTSEVLPDVLAKYMNNQNYMVP